MALNELALLRAHQLIRSFVARHRPPPSFRNRLDIDYRIVDDSVVLLLKRPASDGSGIMLDTPFAKAIHLPDPSRWQVCHLDASQHWRSCPQSEAVDSLEQFITMVEDNRQDFLQAARAS